MSRNFSQFCSLMQVMFYFPLCILGVATGCGQNEEHVPTSEVVFSSELLAPMTLVQGGIIVFVRKEGSTEKVAAGLMDENDSFTLSLAAGTYNFYAVATGRDPTDDGIDSYCGRGVSGGSTSVVLAGNDETVNVAFSLTRNICYEVPFFGDSTWSYASSVGDMYVVACGAYEFGNIAGFYDTCSYFSGSGSLLVESGYPNATMANYTKTGGDYVPTVCVPTSAGYINQKVFLAAGFYPAFLIPLKMTYYDGSTDCSTGATTQWMVNDGLDQMVQNTNTRGKLFFTGNQVPKLFFSTEP